MEWGNYERLRPDELERLVRAAPVAYWPLGLLEHHGWHLPVGFDGVKAQRLCQRMAARTGGVVLPVMWWGGGGGHGEFKWTLYQPVEAPETVLRATLHRLPHFGFRCVVLLAGHYPWRSAIEEVLPEFRREYPDVLVIHGTEADVGAPELCLDGDHAARWETAYGLALLPELVELDALTPGRSEREAWPPGGPPQEEDRHPRVNFAAEDPLFAQYGEDARRADAAEAERALERLAAHVAERVEQHLKEG
ncbi:MAG: creatininase family protein [Planctomycetota bacterium]